MNPVIGIDLGTTNSCVAVTDDRQTVVIPNKGGYKTTPSVIAILDDGRTLVGQIAKRQAITNPKNTISSAKRLIGRRMESHEVKVAKAIYPYDIVEGPHADVRIRCLKREFALPEVSAYVLMEMKRIAEAHLEVPVTDAVVTVPAYFNDAQRQATKDAGNIAGLNVLRIINEPTAAAIAYGFNKKSNKKIAVYDLGGGTFDISILEIHDGVFKVLATSGDTFLGGDDFDNLLIDHVAERFLKDSDINLRENPMALQRLRDACERLKCDLSTFQTAELNLPFITTKASEPVHLSMEIHRRTLEDLVREHVERTLVVSKECLKMAAIDRDDLDDVLLVGGQTRMPMIQDTVSNFFGRSASKQVHPDEVVAIGAAIQGRALAGETEVEMLLLDVTPLSLGIKSAGGTFTRVIEANTTVPVTRKRNFTTVSDNQETVRIQVYQGENPVAEENDLLGEFLLGGIRKAKAGNPEIEVAFDIDANGIVHASAKDLQTGKAQSIKVTMSSGLSEQEIEAAKKEREQYEVRLKGEEESEALAQRIEVLTHRLKKALNEKGERISDKEKNDIKKVLNSAASLAESTDTERMQKAIQELEKFRKELE